MLHKALTSLGAAGRLFHPGAAQGRLRDQGPSCLGPPGEGGEPRHQRRLRDQGRRLRRRGQGEGHRRDRHRPPPARGSPAGGRGGPESRRSAAPDIRTGAWPGVGVVFKLVQALLEDAGKGAVRSPLHEARLHRDRGRRGRAQGGEQDFRQARPQGPGERYQHRAEEPASRPAGWASRKISEGDLGFRIGPRINAAGRMGMTDLAVRLFFSDSPEESRTSSSSSRS